MSRVSCPKEENPENFFFFKIFFSQDFFSRRQLNLDMGVFIRFMGSPDCKDLKNAMEEANFRGT